MALLALQESDSPIETLQGIILLCHWPVPTTSMYKDMTQLLSGAALHLAMQIGLHIVGTGQDFARTVLPSNADHSSRVFRAQLWIQCLITYHSTSLRQGILPLIPLDSPQMRLSNADLPAQFLDDLRIHQKMHNILMAATSSLVRLIPPVGSNSQSKLNPFISLYDAQFQQIAADIRSNIYTIYLYCYRIHLLSYHFLDCPSPNHDGLINLYIISCKLFESLTSQDESTEFSRACPEFIYKTTLLAAISILKIQKSELVCHVNSASGEKAYFSAIYLCQRASFQSDDLGARGVTILGQMWTSKNMYRRPDGRIDSLSTRIRSRLSMSIVFDSFWWWRVEFNGQTSPYPEQNQISSVQLDTAAHSNATQPEASMTTQAIDFPIPGNIDIMPLDEPFPDFDWAVNFEFLEPN
ncbi:Regulatory protein LEU3 [Daldinia childiae]|uniref:Regulatory protein LEU3 n=1 Tax=Daldinia childiae TaxID=326645 RepID=UPI0014489AF3|nr:Regulatory protein LEU3 [Daldinia childiae]KAF3056517.1 Regulatory protein LEU3 [Daldinia childiae]